ncbi:gluconate 2-dehydrogenase subunit 3-like protein [Larkinella arboricola]|uniref:Gluconate 2-dehydrogenase subunit 3-like protein n=1 Tax=Larkinella arboricola TaxID=643671 RepID=A0A327X7I6_LARAB|nr:gluconate 2-dehydrogenase subunit 3 family protein [Larkinella arboricola]RAK02619.1 gluconate 2-dehydrogenase subunit 3-like protein [Larkinella arboricola]
MNRRDALMRVAALMGTTLSLPALADTLEASATKRAVSGKPLLFTADQDTMVAEMTEVIIPTTNTPGAKAAKVNEIIDIILKDCYPQKEQKLFLDGLAHTNELSQASYNKNFVALDEKQRIEVMTKLQAEAAEQRKAMANLPAEQRYTPFFNTLKSLTLNGYFTSQIGATQALEYVAVPGRFQGCIDLKPGQKAWAI